VNRVVNSIRGSTDLNGTFPKICCVAQDLWCAVLIVELNALQLELKGLSQMHSSLSSQYSSLHTIHAKQTHRNTPLGTLLFFARHIFSLYCIYRIFTSGWSIFYILLGRTPVTPDQDPISRFLAILARAWLTTGTYFSETTQPTLNIEAYRRLISFALVGVVIAGSIHSVTRSISRISVLSTSSYVGNPALANLSMSWIAGVYFVSTAVMVRMLLPEEYVGGIGRMLGEGLKRGVFEGWFDAVFFGVACVTGVGLGVVRGWKGGEDGMLEADGKEV